MSTQPLGEEDDDVRTMIDGTLQVGVLKVESTISGSLCVRNFGDGLDISYIQPWIAHRFAEEQLGLGGTVGAYQIIRVTKWVLILN